MEILHTQALLPSLRRNHHSAIAAASAAWSESLPSSSSSSSSAAAVGRHSCRTLPLPPTTPSALRAFSFVSSRERQALCRRRNSVGDSLSIRVCNAPHGGSVAEVGAIGERSLPFCGGVGQFGKCGSRSGRAVVAVASLSGICYPHGESTVDVELEVLRFMQQSGRPDVFPSRQDLVSAGRVDLVKAIREEGGWLSAGWEDEAEAATSDDFSRSGGGNVSTEGKSSALAGKDASRPKRSRRTFRARSLKRSSSAGMSPRVRIDELGRATAEQPNGSIVSREVIKDQDGRRRKKGGLVASLSPDGEPFEHFSILERVQPPYTEKSAVHREKPSANEDLDVLERLSSLLSFTEELKVNRSPSGYQWGGRLSRKSTQSSLRNDFSKTAVEPTIASNFFIDSGTQTDTMVTLPAERPPVDSGGAVKDMGPLPKRKRNPRKKESAPVVEEKSADKLNGSSGRTHDIFDKRETLRIESRSDSGPESFRPSVAVDSKSMNSRIHSLAAKLADTRAALQSGRRALWQTDDEVQQESLAEFIDTEDTLEFRETALMHARNELNTTRAQVSALEGTLNVEIMEARQILEQKSKLVERARNISKKLRTARVVWPNHANEVFLTGSFNGWSAQMKMEKSNAGVFVVSLALYPGKYEIKFVVDGSWSVDTGRPIVYVGGFENNVLTVS